MLIELINLQNNLKHLKLKRSPIGKMNRIHGSRGAIENTSSNIINCYIKLMYVNKKHTLKDKWNEQRQIQTEDVKQKLE